MFGMMYVNTTNTNNRFENALSQAHRRDIISRLFFRRRYLITLEDAIDDRAITNRYSAGIQTVNVKCIIGTVNRNHDFSHDFLPRRKTLRDRWVRVWQAFERGMDLPPVQLIEYDGHYFVVDGHHRISVARLIGQESVSAEVTVLMTT